MTETTNKQTIKERLKIYIKSLNMSVRAFEAACGLSYGYVGNMRTSIQPDKVSRIAHQFPDLNTGWLMTGEGSMLKSGADDAPAATAGTGVVFVPLVEIDSVGGMHSRPLIEPSEQYVSERISLPGARPGDVAIRQSGNSMFPTIPPGAVLLIRCVEDWREYLGYGETYVLLLADGRRLTKQVRRYAPDPEHYVLCASFNPDYDAEELPRSLIRQVWRVVAVVLDHGW